MTGPHGTLASTEQYPLTPDGRYIVARERLWRAANPGLTREERQRLVEQLMDARRALAIARRDGDAAALQRARSQVHNASIALCGQDPPWWTDGAPDLDRHLVRDSPYAQWFADRQARNPPDDAQR